MSGSRRVVAAAIMSATFFALALTGVAQIVSLSEACEGELRIGSSPAVLCPALELPITPTAATILFAVAGLAVSLYLTARLARS